MIDAATGEELPGYGLDDAMPIRADDIAQPIRWRNTAAVSLFKEKPVRLRFELKGSDTELFGFRWGPIVSKPIQLPASTPADQKRSIP